MKLISLQMPMNLHRLWQIKGSKLRLIMTFSLLFSFLGQVCQAQATQSLEEIRSTAKKFLEEKQVSADNIDIEVSVGNIDNRLRLVDCAGKLEAFSPQSTRNTGRMTVGIRCHGSVNWKIFVPAQVMHYQEAWVINRNLSPKDVLRKNDLVRRKVLTSNNRKIPLLELDRILNTSPKKTMRAGTTLYEDSVCLVCRGDKVSVSANNPFLSINVEGIALGYATLGETVQIKNSSSKKIFGAIVTGKNRLSVNITGSK